MDLATMPRMVDTFQLTEENILNGDKLVARILEGSDAERGREVLETAALERFLIPLSALSINQLIDVVNGMKGRTPS